MAVGRKESRMDKKQAKVRIEELRRQIEYHSNRYYNMDSPEITDYEYDMMMQELKKLEKEYAIFKSIYMKVSSQETKEKYEKMEYNDKVSVINGLIDLMQKGQGDLSKLGLGARAGRMSGKNFKTDKLKNMIFIDKSITGMYERRYKINGMENCSSK